MSKKNTTVPGRVAGFLGENSYIIVLVAVRQERYIHFYNSMRIIHFLKQSNFWQIGLELHCLNEKCHGRNVKRRITTVL